MLTGNDRSKFVTTVRDTTFNPELVDGETEHISRKVASKVQTLVALQSDKNHLETYALPPVQKAYNVPVIQNHVSNPRSNLFVVTNDAHSKQTQNGF